MKTLQVNRDMRTNLLTCAKYHVVLVLADGRARRIASAAPGMIDFDRVQETALKVGEKRNAVAVRWRAIGYAGETLAQWDEAII